MVVSVDNRLDVVAGRDSLLPEDKDAVGDAVGKFFLPGMEAGQGADGPGLCVKGNQIARVDILALGIGNSGAGAVLLRPGQAALPASVRVGDHFVNAGGGDRAEELVPRRNTGRNGRLFRVDGLIIVEQRGGGDGGVGEVALVQIQLLEGAEHSVGGDAAQLALLNFDPAGQGGFMQRDGDKITRMDVPCAGHNLYRRRLAHVQLADPHMIGIRMAFHG